MHTLGITPYSSPSSHTFSGCIFKRGHVVRCFQANYVLECDRLLLTQRPEYDVILCLSVTKWVHLNWGDEGLKRFFQRAYRHLRPGGIFVLEPQPWDTYVRRNKLTVRGSDVIGGGREGEGLRRRLNIE